VKNVYISGLQIIAIWGIHSWKIPGGQHLSAPPKTPSGPPFLCVFIVEKNFPPPAQKIRYTPEI